MIKFTSILESTSKKLNILYLHELDENSNSENAKILGNDKVNIIFRKINIDVNILETILSDISNNNIDAVIGDSLCGFIAYHISNNKLIPSLLFNPLFDNNIDISTYTETTNSNQIVIIGLNDDISLPETQLLNVKQLNCKIYVENIGHDIPSDIKLMYYNIFLAELFKDVPYSEYQSTFIHNGNEYSINKLFKITQDAKINKTKIDLLSWIVEFDTTDDTNRNNHIDLSIPIIITISNNKYVVLDGVHRLKKAINDNNDYILTKYIDEDLLKECMI